MGTLIVAVLALSILLVAWWRLWRVLNGDKPIEPGGSYGRQFFGGYRKLEKAEDDDQT